MTAQISDSLKVEYPSIDLEDLLLYGIITSYPNQSRRHQTEWYRPIVVPKEIDPFGPHAVSCNWKGYTRIFTLTEQGELILNYYHYVTKEHEYVNETYEGAFWMVMRKNFFSKDEVYVPFINGKVIANKEEWLRLERRSGSSQVATLEA